MNKKLIVILLIAMLLVQSIDAKGRDRGSKNKGAKGKKSSKDKKEEQEIKKLKKQIESMKKKSDHNPDELAKLEEELKQKEEGSSKGKDKPKKSYQNRLAKLRGKLKDYEPEYPQDVLQSVQDQGEAAAARLNDQYKRLEGSTDKFEKRLASTPARSAYKQFNKLADKQLEEDLTNAAAEFLCYDAFFSTFANLKKDRAATGKGFEKRITADFGSKDGLKKDIGKIAEGESGWVWLLYDMQEEKLHLDVKGLTGYIPAAVGTKGDHPLFVMNFLEDGPASKFGSKAEYIDAHFGILNWNKVSKDYERIVKRVQRSKPKDDL